MLIRKTKMDDLDVVLTLFENARKFMKENGNPSQWTDGYPQRSVIEQDILTGKSYVCVKDQTIIASFYFAVELDPTYSVIKNGRWLNDHPYGVVHRITTNGSERGIATYCLNWCLLECGNLRIDTHANNIPMHNLLIKCGFTMCGIITIKNGDSRTAYQRCDT